ncbi:PREDICTED: wall-associated receptor kinase 3-like, partial [Nelumbo nucifera]|uniref:Wall-associated receptor kinase 3-like n=1 Tax=Nelumbo nucifera TaxID=4432 RepID=A0A1U7Z760_NELNU
MVMTIATALPKSPEIKQLDCQRKCGNVSIPYPFGLVGDDPSCYRDEFKLFCNTATDHRPQLMMYGPDSDEYGDKIVLNISLDGELTFSYWAAVECDMGENRHYTTYIVTMSIGEKEYYSTKIPKAYRFSNSRNKFIAIGCNTRGIMTDYYHLEELTECVSFCHHDTEVTNIRCDGIGCCQKVIPEDLDSFRLLFDSYKKESLHTAYAWNMSKCRMAFLSDEDWFGSSASNLWNSINNVDYLVNVGFRTPVVLDWAIRSNTSCDETQGVTNTDHACGNNTNCIHSKNGPGYLCQ